MINHLLFTAKLYPFFQAPAALERSNFKPPRRLSGGESTKMEQDMQNKPNSCPFQAVSGDYEEKQTQTNPIQTQNKAIFCAKNRPQTQYRPNSNPIKPNFRTSPFVLPVLRPFLLTNLFSASIIFSCRNPKK